MNKKIRAMLDDIANETCGARGRYKEHRPHTVVDINKRGKPVFRVEEEVNRGFICLKGKGHDGPHHDTVRYVQWSD